MGQYFTAMNLTAGECLDADELHDQIKLGAIAYACEPGGVASALVLLLANDTAESAEQVRHRPTRTSNTSSTPARRPMAPSKTWPRWCAGT